MGIIGSPRTWEHHAAGGLPFETRSRWLVQKGDFHGRGTVQSSFVHHLHHARLPAPPFVHPEGGDVPRAFRHRVLHHSAVHHHNQHQRRARDFRNALARRSGRALQRPHGRHRLRDDPRQGPAGTGFFHAQSFGLQHRHVRHAFRRRVPPSHRVPGNLPVRRRERDHVHGRDLRARQQRHSICPSRVSCATSFRPSLSASI